MPRTFIALEKRYIDDKIIPEGAKFTTDFFDDPKKKVPSSLEEVDAKGADAESGKKSGGGKSQKSATGDYTEEQLNGMSQSDLGKICKKLQIDNYTDLDQPARVMAILSIQEANAKSQDTSNPSGAGTAMKVESGSQVNPQ